MAKVRTWLACPMPDMLLLLKLSLMDGCDAHAGGHHQSAGQLQPVRCYMIPFHDWHGTPEGRDISSDVLGVLAGCIRC